MKISCIYKIRSIIKPERVYIGSTCNFYQRMHSHKNELREGKHHSIILQRHYDKYGDSDLVFDIISNVYGKENLLIEEQKLLDDIKPYFNVSTNATSRLGCRARYKRIVSDETKRRMSESAKKVVKKTGWKHKQETILKMRLAQSGRKVSVNTTGRKTGRAVFNVFTGEKYISVRNAAVKNNISHSGLMHILKGRSLNKLGLIYAQ